MTIFLELMKISFDKKVLQMLQYKKIDLSEGINVAKSSKSIECMA